MHQRSRTGEASGYTPIELLVVLTILGFVALSAPALLSKALPGFTAKTAAARLASDLRSARVNALQENREQSVAFDRDKSSHTIGDRHVTLPGGVAWLIEDGTGRAPTSNAFVLAFYPDGSSSGATITLNFHGRLFRVTDHWLTGQVTSDD